MVVSWACVSFNGLGGIPSPFQWVLKPSAQALDFALLTLGFVALAYFYFERSLNSPWGRMLKSIRDDPVASKTFGKNVTKARIQVMVIGSAFAGVAGALFTFYSNYVTPDNFIPVVTFNVWVMIVLGGLGNNKGALLGTLIVTLLQKVLSIVCNHASISKRRVDIELFRLRHRRGTVHRASNFPAIGDNCRKASQNAGGCGP